MKVNLRKIVATYLPFLILSFIMLIPYFANLVKQKIIAKVTEETENTNEEKGFIRVAIVEDKAYWIIENTLWQAQVVDGEIMKDDARPIDAFDIDYKELNKMMNILDHMQDWKN